MLGAKKWELALAYGTGLEQRDFRGDDKEMRFYSKDSGRPLQGFQHRCLHDPLWEERLSLQLLYGKCILGKLE